MSSEAVSTQLKIRLNIKIKPKICTLVLESQPEHIISAKSKQKYCSTEKRLLLNANTGTVLEEIREIDFLWIERLGSWKTAQNANIFNFFPIR